MIRWSVQEIRRKTRACSIKNATVMPSLDERTSGGNDGENSWLASFVADGPNGTTMAFWLDQRIVGAGAWKKLVKSSEMEVVELRQFGFGIDEDDDRRLSCRSF